MKIRSLALRGALLAAAAIPAACGGNSDTKSPGGAGTDASATGGESGGSGGPGAGGGTSDGGENSGGNAAGGTPGAGGAIQTVTCGGVECPIALTGACCMDDACGFTDPATSDCMPPVECGGEACPVQVPGTCCVGSLCGTIDEMSGECVDPLVALRDGGTELEPIVTDPACGTMTFAFFGQSLPLSGCCDVTGVCGGNTGDLPPLAGLSLPTLCLTPVEGQSFFLTGPTTDVPCGDGGGPSPSDAGAEQADGPVAPIDAGSD